MKKIGFALVVAFLGILVLNGSVIGVTSDRSDRGNDNPYTRDRNDFTGFEQRHNESGVSAVKVNNKNQEQEMEERVNREVESMGKKNKDKKLLSTDSNKGVNGDSMLYMVVSFIFGIVIGVIGVVSLNNCQNSTEEIDL